MNVQVIPTPGVFLGADTIICAYSPLRLNAAVPGAAYLWSTGSSDGHIDVAVSGTYWLEVNLEGCIVSDTISITAEPAPDIDLGGDRDICPGQEIMLDATHEPNSSYLWNTGDTTPVITAREAGVYSVRVTSRYQCTGTDSVLLTYYPRPLVTLGADTTICEDVPLLLSAYHVHADSVVWSGGSVGERLSVQYGGTYIARGINKCGTGADTVLVMSGSLKNVQIRSIVS